LFVITAFRVVPAYRFQSNAAAEPAADWPGPDAAGADEALGEAAGDGVHAARMGPTAAAVATPRKRRRDIAVDK
jgi:hypothetical protein